MEVNSRKKKLISFNKIPKLFIFLILTYSFFRGTAISGFSMFSGLGMIDHFFSVCRYIGIALMLVRGAYYLLLGLKKGKVNVSIYLILLSLLLLLTTYSTWKSGVDMEQCISFVVNIAVAAFYFHWIILSKDTEELELFTISLNILQFVNLFTIILFYGGMEYANSSTVMGSVGDVYFLGYDNGLISFVLPTIVLNYYLLQIRGKNIYKLFNLICILQVVITLSVTGIIGLFLILVLMKSRNLYKMLSGKKAIVVSGILFIGLISMQLQKLFSILLNAYNIGLTLGGRTVIWGWALEYIKESPLIGYGYNIERAKTVFFWRIGVSGAHNQILDVLLHSGIVGLFLFLVIVAVPLGRLGKIYRHEHMKYQKLLIISISVYLVIMMVESYSAYSSYPLLFVLLEFAWDMKRRMSQNASIIIKA
ncbi:O-antigen ligase family protein [Desulfosporosinus sp. Sb-LF]|uniref:O-antigen ligase family protein n=1 Tax=Desulfosporosinus sp. Sb-LF TaxID=2560027 RepID=UPI00107F3CF6|nr:O-antigen ligase family protein [Desulfosporosinus sp. Sb-LF]TGE31896.1 O-antigen ligase domain-containing protein [Desulfosporosinus sp. Sb-LF]